MNRLPYGSQPGGAQAELEALLEAARVFFAKIPNFASPSISFRFENMFATSLLTRIEVCDLRQHNRSLFIIFLCVLSWDRYPKMEQCEYAIMKAANRPGADNSEPREPKALPQHVCRHCLQLVQPDSLAGCSGRRRVKQVLQDRIKETDGKTVL